MKHPDKWYQRRLSKYFDAHYSEYEDAAEWWSDPEPNQWLFDIPKLSMRVELTCNDKGVVTEQIYKIDILGGRS